MGFARISSTIDIAILIKVIAVDHVSIKITAQTVNVKLELEMESQMH